MTLRLHTGIPPESNVVDLRGQLSNPETLGVVAQAAQAVAGITAEHGQEAAPPPASRRWRLGDRLGEQVISDLLADRRAGATKRALAEHYGISLSSVKRLLH